MSATTRIKNVKPLAKFVLAELEDVSSPLILPDNVDNANKRFKVVDVGPEVTKVKVGMYILPTAARPSGRFTDAAKRDLWLLEEEDIYCELEYTD
jgi:hypothetical protein